MRNSNKKAVTVLLHLLFWAIITYFFYSYSFLRPGTIDARYKEFICVVFTALMVYINYLFLIPKYFQTGRFVQFWLFSILTILLAGMGEFFMVKPDILKILVPTLPEEIINHFLFVSVFLINIRYFCFFLFFFLLRIYQDMSKEYLLEKQAVAKHDKTLYINQGGGNIQEVQLADIVYISQSGNRTFFHLANGKVYEQYSSLQKTEAILPEGLSLRISRNYIIMFSQVIDFDDYCVKLNLNENGKPVLLEISLKHQKEVLDALESQLKIQKSKNVGINPKNVGMKDENIGVNLIKNQKISDKNDVNSTPSPANDIQEAILAYISDHPGCNVPDIADSIYRTSRTVERHLSDLKTKGLIEYKGARRNGGYYLIENSHSS